MCERLAPWKLFGWVAAGGGMRTRLGGSVSLPRRRPPGGGAGGRWLPGWLKATEWLGADERLGAQRSTGDWEGGTAGTAHAAQRRSH